MSDQGYMTLATGATRYFEAAVNLALSVRRSDPARPISLLCDRSDKLGSTERTLFDHIITLPPHPSYRGCADKLRVPRYAPYGETVFLDSDCLITKPDMDRHWQRLAGPAFSLAGAKSSGGTWYGRPIQAMLAAQAQDWLVQMNSGVFYMRRGDTLDQFMDHVDRLTRKDGPHLVLHRGVAGQIADEPIWGLAMGHFGFDPVRYSAEEGSVMVTTYQAKGCLCDPVAGISRVIKPTGFRIAGRLWARGWVTHSPTIVHFIAFAPARTYRNAVNALRAEAGFPPGTAF